MEDYPKANVRVYLKANIQAQKPNYCACHNPLKRMNQSIYLSSICDIFLFKIYLVEFSLNNIYNFEITYFFLKFHVLSLYYSHETPS